MQRFWRELMSDRVRAAVATAAKVLASKSRSTMRTPDRRLLLGSQGSGADPGGSQLREEGEGETARVEASGRNRCGPRARAAGWAKWPWRTCETSFTTRVHPIQDSKTAQEFQAGMCELPLIRFLALRWTETRVSAASSDSKRGGRTFLGVHVTSSSGLHHQAPNFQSLGLNPTPRMHQPTRPKLVHRRPGVDLHFALPVVLKH